MGAGATVDSVVMIGGEPSAFGIVGAETHAERVFGN